MSCSDPACFYGRRGLGQYTRQLEVCVDRCEKNRHFGFFHSWLPEPASCSGTWTRLDKALCMDMNNNVCKGLSTLVPGRKHFPGHTAGSCVLSSREEAGLSHVVFPGEGLVCAPVMMGEQAIVKGALPGMCWIDTARYIDSTVLYHVAGLVYVHITYDYRQL